MRNYKSVAAEILTSGICPYNCSYCYIPKTPAMSSIHKRIVSDLKSGLFIERLEKISGEDLETLSLWGTEPTLTIDLLIPHLPEMKKKFPKLKKICFSTSLFTVEPLVQFIKAANHIEIELQFSVDGPAFISDKTRVKGYAEKVTQEFIKLVEALQTVSTKVSLHWKSTLSLDILVEMNYQPELITEFCAYFMHLVQNFKRINKNEKLTLQIGYMPTLVVPGRYSSDDGKTLATFWRNWRLRGYKNGYSLRLRKMINFWDQLGYKRAMFTCSGGDSNVGIDQNMHICHRSYYLDDDKYVESALSQEGVENWDVSHFRRGDIDYVRKAFIVDYNNELEVNRFAYIMRGYHDFWRFQLSYCVSMLQELALIGQVDCSYRNEEKAMLLGMYLAACSTCPMENTLNASSVLLTPISIFRLYGNGAFEEIIYGL